MQMTREYLKYSGSDIRSTAFTTAVGTYYSDPIRPHYSTGKAALLVKTSAGALTVTYEVSSNGTDWYEPYDTTGSTVNTVVTDLASGRLIYFEPVVTELMRFKFVLTGANSTVSVIYIQQERAR